MTALYIAVFPLKLSNVLKGSLQQMFQLTFHGFPDFAFGISDDNFRNLTHVALQAAPFSRSILALTITVDESARENFLSNCIIDYSSQKMRAR